MYVCMYNLIQAKLSVILLINLESGVYDEGLLSAHHTVYVFLGGQRPV